SHAVRQRRSACAGAADTGGTDRGRRGPLFLPRVAGVVGPLFDDPEGFDRAGLSAKLRELASEHIYIGGNSWKYRGWPRPSYSREWYLSRGKFSRKIFEAECLRESARTFPTVCGDFAFYQFPTMEFWDKLFRQTPAGFRFAFKVPEQITCKVFPTHPRYGPHA